MLVSQNQIMANISELDFSFCLHLIQIRAIAKSYKTDVPHKILLVLCMHACFVSQDFPCMFFNDF